MNLQQQLMNAIQTGKIPLDLIERAIATYHNILYEVPGEVLNSTQEKDLKDIDEVYKRMEVEPLFDNDGQFIGYM